MYPKIKNHNVNRLVSLLAFICLTSFTYTFAGGSGQGAAVHTLVIDPGHGGMDPGAIGPGGHHEADLALAVSLKFGEMVKQAFPDVKIIYTRTTDKFVSLADRADMANKAKADLFICIHLNSTTNHDAYGTSTYVLGLHRTDDNLEVAKRENAVIELEGDKDKNYEFDPNSPEGHIIMSMKQNAFLDQSILIASKIEDQLAELSKRKSRGVKQAGFWVLYKTAMPSLLAEIGFISNPTEEQYLSSDEGQTNIATSIFKAFRSYKYQIEGIKDTNALANQPAPVATPQTTAPPVAQNITPTKTAPTADSQQPITQSNPAPKKEEKIVQPDTSAVAASVAKAPDTIRTAPTKDFIPISQVAAVIPDTSKPVMPAPAAPKKPVPLKDNKATTAKKPAPQDTIAKLTKPQGPVTATTSPAPTAKPVKTADNIAPASKTTPGSANESAYFTVQLLAAKHKPGNYDDLVNTFGLIDREDIGDGVVRYMAGEYATFKEAKKALELAHGKGIKDAFIVGYLNRKRQDGKGTLALAQRHP